MKNINLLPNYYIEERGFRKLKKMTIIYIITTIFVITTIYISLCYINNFILMKIDFVDILLNDEKFIESENIKNELDLKTQYSTISKNIFSLIDKKYILNQNYINEIVNSVDDYTYITELELNNEEGTILLKCISNSEQSIYEITNSIYEKNIFNEIEVLEMNSDGTRIAFSLKFYVYQEI